MTAVGALNSLRILASQAFGAAGLALDPFSSAGPSSEVTYLDEIASHAAAIRALLEDIRKLLNASAAPGVFASPAAAAEEVPAPGRTDSLLPGAGHLTATPQCLRVAARGLRQWLDGDVCTATSYWRSIAASLDAVAGAREAITDITK